MREDIDIIFENRSGREVHEERLAELARTVLKRLGLSAGELGITLIKEPEMAVLNREFMSVEGPTDVLSFPLDADEAEKPGEQPLLLGDVVICTDVAAQQAEAMGNTEDQEICLLLIHGILHVAGYDHETDAGEMNGLQETLFGELCGKKILE